MPDHTPLHADIREFVITEFLHRQDPGSSLTASTPLLSGGIIDSLGVLRLVAHIESRFNIFLEPHEADQPYLDTIDLIARLVVSKRGPTAAS
jgi:acyl carrier protein